MKYSKHKIRQAGKVFKGKRGATEDDIEFANNALTYWRTIHGKLILEIQTTIEELAMKVDDKAFVAKRLKRSPSIIAKLKRLNHIQLSTMQDIAGMRVVVSSIAKVKKLVKLLSEEYFDCELRGKDDYIERPKESGYRGVHLIYRYKNDGELKGLNIEVQVRTQKQHAWATAVETMGTYLDSHLKFSEGKPKWLKYFALTGSAFAYMEKTSPVPSFSNYNEEDTYEMALYEYRYNEIENRLRAYTLVSKVICEEKYKDKKYHIVILDVKKKIVRLISFREKELELANEKYTQFERETDETKQIVLVSTESINKLKEAYPNYFLDTKEFLRNMRIIERRRNKIRNLKDRNFS